MVKLIVSDLDGTLVNDESVIDPQFYEILPQLKERGIRFALASGRPYSSLRENFKEYLDEMILIAENGALIMDNGRELFSHCMNRRQIMACLDAIGQVKGAEAMVCAKEYSYTTSEELYRLLTSPRYRYSMQLVEDLYAVEDEIIKVSAIDHSGRTARECYDLLRPVLDREIELMVSGKFSLDTGVNGVDKGSAVAALQQMWRITPEETAVFGDQHNDVAMFRKAAYSFAMAGAAEDVKQHARFQAGSNNEGGVVRAIRQMVGL